MDQRRELVDQLCLAGAAIIEDVSARLVTAGREADRAIALRVANMARAGADIVALAAAAEVLLARDTEAVDLER
ncbi:MAG: hypothetical protein ACRYG4_12955 [Janthinobacterium lividum]